MENRVRIFRAWDGKIIQPCFSVNSHNGCAMGFVKGEFTELKNWIVSEWTGLHDKNGKKIFEGDILKTLHFMEGKKKHWLYHRVEWCKRMTGWQAIARGQNGEEHNGNPQLWVYMKNSACEIIGNIFENPELITNC